MFYKIPEFLKIYKKVKNDNLIKLQFGKKMLINKNETN
jgi:hypothetical protein